MNNFIKNFISFRLAYATLMLLTLIVLIYHALIITGVIAYSNVWGGRLTSIETMYVFEAISLSTQILFTLMATFKYIKIGSNKVQKILTKMLYFLSGLLVLNTISNIFSTSSIEVLVFAPMTFIMSFTVYRLALGNK